MATVRWLVRSGPPVYPDGMETAALPTSPTAIDGAERGRLVARARLLAWAGIGWHAIEAAIAIGAGAAAGSIALVGFGGDSLIESVAGFFLLWRFAGGRASSDAAERRAQQMIAASFYVLAAYVAVEAVRSLSGGTHPEVSWV